MFGKGIGYFLLLVLLVDPSSAFLPKTCSDLINIEFDRFEILLQEDIVSHRLVKEAAAILLGTFKENPDLTKEFPSMNGVLELLVGRDVDIITKENLAFISVTVYLAAVILTSYCFLDHSKRQLAQLRFRFFKKPVYAIVDLEIKPIFRYIEMLLKGDKQEIACNMEIKQYIKRKKESECQQLASTTGYYICCTDSGVVAVPMANVMAGRMAASMAAPMVDPMAGLMGGPMAFLTQALSGGTLNWPEKSKLTYEQELELLKKIEDKAFEAVVEANKAITMLQTHLDLVCLHGFRKLEGDLNWI